MKEGKKEDKNERNKETKKERRNERMKEKKTSKKERTKKEKEGKIIRNQEKKPFLSFGGNGAYQLETYWGMCTLYLRGCIIGRFTDFYREPRNCCRFTNFTTFGMMMIMMMMMMMMMMIANGVPWNHCFRRHLVSISSKFFRCFP